MKNSIKIFSIVLASALMMAGCSNGTESSVSQTTQTNSSSSETSQSNENAPKDDKGKPEITSLAENQTEVVGKVTSVTGNELVLALGTMEMPEKPDGEAPASGEQSGSDTQSADGSDKPNGTSPSGEAPKGEKPTGDKPAEDAPQGDGQQMGGGVQAEITLTGESATYTIADNAAITSMGKTNETLDVSSITADTNIKAIVETADDGKQTIVKIQILS